MARTDENTSTKIDIIREQEEAKAKTNRLLEKCKKRDKDKEEYLVTGFPVKTIFVCKNRANFEKTKEKFLNRMKYGKV